MPVVIAAIGLYFLFSYISEGKKFVDTLGYSIASVKFDKNKFFASGFSDVYLNVIVKFINSTSFAITIDNVNINIIYSGIIIGRIQSTREFKINANVSTPVNFIVVISTNNLIDAAPQLIQSLKNFNVANVNLQLKGIIKHSLGTTDINETVKLIA